MNFLWKETILKIHYFIINKQSSINDETNWELLEMNIRYYIAFLLLSIVILSCQDIESKKVAQVLTKENLKLKDSIDKILSLRERTFLIDSVKMDYSKGILGALTFTDTLVLSARFSDCGEFGGHKEYLKIYSEKEKYMCLFIKQMVDCEKSYTDFVKIDSILFELSENNQKRVLEYMFELTKVSMLHQDLADHRSNYYEMFISSGLSGPPYFIESPIMKWNFGDQSLKWPGYIDLRDDIKTSANKAINER